MQSGANVGMHTLNSDLARLIQKSVITKQQALKYSNDRADLEQFL
jgi:twitching motility protein PilT